jgi:NitT/TauT family transport system permease protein
LGKIVLATLFLILVWAGLSALLRKPFLPSPALAGAAFAKKIADGTLFGHIGASLRRIFLSLAVAGPPAWALGLLSGRIKTADTLTSPLVYLLHPLPKVAFLPILLLFFGLGDASKVALMGLVVFGQLFVGARDSAKAIPSSLIDTVRSLGCGSGGILRWAILPATLPSLLSSLRISLGTAIAVLFLSETFASMDGLGWYIMDAWSRVNYPDMYAAIIALSLVGLLLYLALDAVEAFALRWRETD